MFISLVSCQPHQPLTWKKTTAFSNSASQNMLALSNEGLWSIKHFQTNSSKKKNKIKNIIDHNISISNEFQDLKVPRLSAGSSIRGSYRSRDLLKVLDSGFALWLQHPHSPNVGSQASPPCSLHTTASLTFGIASVRKSAWQLPSSCKIKHTHTDSTRDEYFMNKILLARLSCTRCLPRTG